MESKLLASCSCTLFWSLWEKEDEDEEEEEKEEKKKRGWRWGQGEMKVLSKCFAFDDKVRFERYKWLG